MNSSLGKQAALIYGPDLHYLDHLAAVSDLLDIPLIVTDKEIESVARKYYPYLDVLYYSYNEATSSVVQNYDIIFTCMPRPLFDEAFFLFQKLLQKRVPTLWVPHGNSDKGHASLFMEALAHEEAALLYGKKMVDFLKEKNAFENLKGHVLIGNIRLALYQRHEAFYRKLIEREISKKLNPEKKTILYAPTWQDAEKSSSFFKASPHLLKNLPEEYNLIVKLHPNQLLAGDSKIEELLSSYKHHPQILFLTHFPPIYPLLDSIDIYIGDMSSIGYDCLAFNKPLFFLNQNKRNITSDPGLYLYRAGVEITPEEYAKIYSIIEKNIETDSQRFSLIRKEIYSYTFAEEKTREMLREEIIQLYHLFSEKNLSFF